MAEPSLSCGSQPSDSYRFVWLRTFHAPIAIRVDLGPTQTSLTLVVLSGAGGYEPGVVVERKSRELTTQERESLLAALRAAEFWHASSWQPVGGLDGAEWVYEARRGARYHVVDRWSPKTGPFYELGRRFVALAGIQVPAGDFY
jgi:hypothetical protein